MATTFTDISKNLDSYNDDVSIDSNTSAINNTISNILTISKGELPGRPDFGSELRQYLFEPADEITFISMEEVVRNALLEFETRIEVTDVEFESFVEQNIVVMTLQYTVLNSGSRTVYSKTFDVLG